MSAPAVLPPAQYYARISAGRTFHGDADDEYTRTGLHIGHYHARRDCTYLRPRSDQDHSMFAVIDVTAFAAMLPPCSRCVPPAEAELVRRQYPQPQGPLELEAGL